MMNEEEVNERKEIPVSNTCDDRDARVSPSSQS